MDGFLQDCNNFIANALELLQSCTKPSNYMPRMCDTVKFPCGLFFWEVNPCLAKLPLKFSGGLDKLELIPSVRRPIWQIPQCISQKSYNAPFYKRNVHISVQNGAFGDMGLVHCGICATSLLGHMGSTDIILTYDGFYQTMSPQGVLA